MPKPDRQYPDKRLLVIYYNFPPVKVPGAVRVAHLCRSARRHFGKVYALSSNNREFFPKDDSLEVPEVPVSTVVTWDLRRLLALRRNEQQPFISGSAKSSYWGRILRRLVDSFPLNILVGDGGLIYILNAYRAARKMVEQEGITHVFSTFRPYSDHLIAFLLKGRFPHLVWIADFRDLHLDEKHGRQLFCWPLQVWCNKKIMGRADRVTTVSKGLAAKLTQLVPSVQLLRNGIPDSLGAPQPLSCFTIAYTGRIYPGEQSATLLFAVVAQLIENGQLPAHQLQLTYAGPTPELWRQWGAHYGLEDQLDIRGLLPLREARQLQMDSAINLQLAFSRPEQKGDLSSKVYEYLAAGNPILAIVKGEQDAEFDAFFATFQAGLLVYDRPEDQPLLSAFIRERYAAWQQGKREVWPKNQKAVAAWKTDVLMERFFTALLDHTDDSSEHDV